MYVKANNQTVEKFPYTIGDLRRDNPNVSFPKHPQPELLAEWGVYPVSVADYVAPDPNQVAEQSAEPTFQNGEWVLDYTVRDMTADEISHLSDLVRSERNAKLSECDWTQLSDAPLTDAEKQSWAAYRQALRDITDQAEFPFNVQWPNVI